MRSVPIKQCLKKSVAEFLKKEAPYDIVKEIYESEDGYSPKMWKKMSQLDWLGVPFQEEYDGLEEPFMSLCLVLEEMGKAGFPSPYFSTVVLGGLTILAGGNDKQKEKILKKVIKGKQIIATALYQDTIGYDFSSTNVSAKKADDVYVLNGENLIAHDANIAGIIIVPAETENGITLFLLDAKADGVKVTRIKSIGNDNLCTVDIKDVQVKHEDMLGQDGHGEDILKKVVDKAIVAKCAEMLGGCAAAIDLAAKYARQRIQYGVPIGGQQAIQHRLADMQIAYDTCLHYFYKVVWMIEENMEFEMDAYALKAKLSECSNFIGYHAVRIHGGVGLTDEFSVALYFRKAKASEFNLGDPLSLYEKVAESLLDN